jgi:hypothetical protein
MLRHPDRRDYRIHREDKIDDGNLHDRGGHRSHDRPGTALVFGSLDPLVDLAGTLHEQEQPAREQNKIAP